MVRRLSEISHRVTSVHGTARMATNLGRLQHYKHLHSHVVADPTRHRSTGPKDEADALGEPAGGNGGPSNPADTMTKDRVVAWGTGGLLTTGTE